MKVKLEKFGGIAAGMTRPPQVVDGALLEAPAAAELRRLVQAAKAAPKAQTGVEGQARDAMSYDVTIEDDGGSIVLSQDDTNMSPEFAELMRWIRKRDTASEAN